MIGKTAEYALRAIVFLGGQQGQPSSADLLAKKTKAPRRYLHRVLQDLAVAGLVSSRSGPGGGYLLALPPATISILDVINAVAPLERINACPLGLKSHASLCPLHKELDEAFAVAEAAFQRVNIQSLLDSTSAVVPLCES